MDSISISYRQCSTGDEPQALLDPSRHEVILGVQRLDNVLHQGSGIKAGESMKSQVLPAIAQADSAISGKGVGLKFRVQV